MRHLMWVMLASAILLASCGPKQDQAGRAVEGYLKAIATKDSSQLSAISCGEWEKSAQTELDSFQAVDVKLQDVSCATTGTEGESILVGCQGKLVATYGSENQELDLSTRTYLVVKQGSEWLVCGER